MASLWTLPQGDGIWSLAVTLGTLKIISEGFSYFENFNFYFIYKELVLFLCKDSACSAGDLGSILGLGRSPGEGNGNPLQYSCLSNPMDRGARQATDHGVAKSQT